MSVWIKFCNLEFFIAIDMKKNCHKFFFVFWICNVNILSAFRIFAIYWECINKESSGDYKYTSIKDLRWVGKILLLCWMEAKEDSIRTSFYCEDIARRSLNICFCWKRMIAIFLHQGNVPVYLQTKNKVEVISPISRFLIANLVGYISKMNKMAALSLPMIFHASTIASQRPDITLFSGC